MNENNGQKRLNRWMDRQDIRGTLAAHGRGVDRCDEALLRSAYHDDGEVDYGFFQGSAREFAQTLCNAQREQPVTLHRTQNVWIRHEGDRVAISESYALAYAVTPGADGFAQSLIGGRYLDRLARRNERWKMTKRTYVLDWNINLPVDGTGMPGVPDIFITGDKAPEDAGFRMVERWYRDAGQDNDGEYPMKIEGALAQRIENALAREDIHDLIVAQARATDRGDAVLMKSLYHTGATVDIGPFPDEAQSFCDALISAMAHREKMFHSVSNEWIDVRGDEAVAESYVVAFTIANEEEPYRDELTGGRYLDRFERRDGVWKFVHRAFVADWQISQPSTDRSNDDFYAVFPLRGTRSSADPVYPHWARGGQ